MVNKGNFTAADTLPVKLLQDVEVIEAIKTRGFIPPKHAQIIPTNRCNLKCSFCSCAEDDRKTEMSSALYRRVIHTLSDLGTEAITITGGGEPLLHKDIAFILDYTHGLGIEMGLVTNGLLLSKQDFDLLNKVTWVRISHDDFRPFTREYVRSLKTVVEACPDVDWAFSYVVSRNPELSKIKAVINFANDHGFTHVRLVSDLLDVEHSKVDFVRKALPTLVDVGKVIFQKRTEPERGGACYICHLKPLIAPDGKVYTCCGAQYAFKEPSRSLPKELCLGTYEELGYIQGEDNILPFDGSICDRCYYMDYNRVLKAICTPITKHEEFV
ncbi:hypothetical protein LCGC14_0717580 [marine sediment metagenome]|uniref:Radical SAM core domain-containing protein n=1 Tax=marine sediment metagenome TaxID=412755 RepID=A0A0F9TKR8_9ZZZZ